MSIKLKKYGYHITKIKKGIIGDSSKILEEVEELIDAEKQESRVMVIVELSDLIGAINLYIQNKRLGVTVQDLEKMSIITKRAFENGFRK